MLKKIITALSCARGKNKTEPCGYVRGLNILDEYAHEKPSHQLAVDIFEGEWSCAFPAELGIRTSRKIPAFDDRRVKWAAEVMGGFKGKKVLELGPLEGGHTYMLDQGGASHVLSIEANKRAYLKCLIAKEVTGMRNANFVFGDFNEYLRNTDEKFDVTFASGILYHMLNPAETIELISKVSDSVFIWSLYYDKDVIDSKPHIKKTMGKSKAMNHNGFKHTLYEHHYMEFLSVSSFCGGSNPSAFWMTKNEMLDCLRYFGFKNITIGLEEPDHRSGSALCVVGQK